MLKIICRWAAQKLLDSSWNLPMLRLEDVFWTGIVAQKAGIKPTGRNDVFHYYQVNPVRGCMYSRIISSHMCKYQDPKTCSPTAEMHKAHRAVVESTNCPVGTWIGPLGLACTYMHKTKDFLCQSDFRNMHWKS